MSRIVLGAFVMATGLAVAAADYTTETRHRGLSLGKLEGATYLAGLRDRLLTDAERAPGAGETGGGLPFGALAGAATRSLEFLRGGAPIDMVAFDGAVRRAERAGAPSGDRSFTPAAPLALSAGACVTNGAFKRCRVGN